MIKAVIFDLDGTLLDTINDLRNAVNKALENTKYSSISYEDTKVFTGNGFRNLLSNSMPNASDQEIDESLVRFKEAYKDCYNDKTEPYKGIYEVLRQLSNMGIIISVNSNKGQIFTQELIKKHFNDINFYRIIGQRPNIPLKPDPYSANEIINELKLNNKEVIYIGDSLTDIKTGINANIKTIGCSWGFKGRKVLEDAKVEIIIDKPEEIIGVIKRINEHN